MASSSNDRVRFRYGMCLNDGCSKAKAKEVQEIPSRKEFVCAECGKALRECPPPKKGGNKGLIIAIIAVLAIAAGGAAMFFMPESDKKAKEPKKVNVPAPEPAPAPEPVPAPEPAPAPEPEPTPAPAPDPNVVVTKDLGYAVYKGRMKNGKMNDDNGVLTFKETHIIEQRDIKKRTAQPGEKVIGIFEDGHLVTGTWHKKDGNKETIIP